MNKEISQFIYCFPQFRWTSNLLKAKTQQKALIYFAPDLCVSVCVCLSRVFILAREHAKLSSWMIQGSFHCELGGDGTATCISKYCGGGDSHMHLLSEPGRVTQPPLSSRCESGDRGACRFYQRATKWRQENVAAGRKLGVYSRRSDWRMA